MACYNKWGATVSEYGMEPAICQWEPGGIPRPARGCAARVAYFCDRGDGRYGLFGPDLV